MSIPILMLLIVILVAISAIVLAHEGRIRAADARVQNTLGVREQSIGVDSFLVGMTAKLGDRFRHFYSASSIDQMRAVVQASGFNSRRLLPILIGAKVGLMMLCFAIATMVAMTSHDVKYQLSVFAIGLGAGVVGPDWVLRIARRRYNAAIQRGTPEAIDLLVVCSEAGMGLESALERVAEEMRRSNAAMGKVLDGLLEDLRVLDRREAFENLTNRSTFDGIRRFGTMINQSLQYGTPISDTLRAIAEELRRDRMNRLEERASKLGAKLLFPMVMFMLPAIMCVAMGGSFLNLIDTFTAIGR